jgi:hypothetical protein
MCLIFSTYSPQICNQKIPGKFHQRGFVSQGSPSRANIHVHAAQILNCSDFFSHFSSEHFFLSLIVMMTTSKGLKISDVK